ncbi:hypothetical protein LCGC14_1013080 [marine sediment metagenome]|uniref:Helicase ATP-binding domain-containing protein n=1 Tax=marine sediment metagenome TaxID=412755 RepID=A0A0F9N475_9ZZZZ
MRKATTHRRAVLTDRNFILIEFPYDRVMIDRVREIPGRMWDTVRKIWIAPLSNTAIQVLDKNGFRFNKRLRQAQTTLEQPYKAKPLDTTVLPMRLYRFQKKGVEFIQSRKGRALVADDMGLGKTIQALAWLALNPKVAFPAIVVCPASVKLAWEREAGRWVKDRFAITLDGHGGDTLPMADIYIINYDILSPRKVKGVVVSPGWVQALIKLNAKTIVIDEIHYLKSTKTQRTKSIKQLTASVPYVIGLSGTPIINRPVEAFEVISIINPQLFPHFFSYARRYCDAKPGAYGWDFKGSSNTEELHKVLTSTIMIRRTKTEVLPQLPPKQRNIVPFKITNRIQYNHAEADLIDYLQSKGLDEAADRARNAEHLVKTERLKQIMLEGKIKGVIDWIANFLNSSMEKLVVFGEHKSAIKEIMKHFGTKLSVQIVGGMSTAQKQKAVDAFQTDPNTRLMVANTKAGGIGITLTAASNVAFVELPWTPGALVQAEDRVLRIGQEAQNVQIWYLLAQGTIEEDIATMLDTKTQVLAQVLDGAKVNEDKSILKELMKGLKAQKRRDL